MIDVHAAMLAGSASQGYNYNIIPISQHEIDFINNNDMEFVLMFGGSFVNIDFANETGIWPPTNWTLTSTGTNRRCYLWGSMIPTSPTSSFYGSDVCTTPQIIELINTTKHLLTTPIKRVLLFNEPWSNAAYPENATTTAWWVKNVLEEVVAVFGLDITSATSYDAPRALEWDTEFFKACMDYGCNLNLFTQWSIHDYQTKYNHFETKYSLETGTFYTTREAAFSDGYGSWSASQWSEFFRRQPLLFTEHSAEQETQTSFGVPDNTGTCLRVTGQFGDPAQCNLYGHNGGACSWGAGTLAWLLEPERTNVAGVYVWPAYYSPIGHNQHGGRSSRLVYEDGGITPMGRAFLAMPENGLTVDCITQSSPSPPPMPRPPLIPLDCDAMTGRLNTVTTFDPPRFCYELHSNTALGCDSYYSMGNNQRMRLCYNPGDPSTSSPVYCSQTDFTMC